MASYTNSDENILALLQSRETKGLTLLYDKYANVLLGAIIRVVGSRVLAEEYMQIIFERIWRQFEYNDPSKGKLFVWLMQFSRNTAIELAKTKGYSTLSQPRDYLEKFIDFQQNIATNPDTSALKNIVNSIGIEYRHLLELTYFQGFNQEEAAAALGITPEEVNERLKKAVSELRRLF